MDELPEPIKTYISAYNEKNVAGMVSCLADDIHFQNYSGPELTAEAIGKPAFEEMAKFGATAFSVRRQEVIGAITVADTTMVKIDYSAVVAMDLPNGWKVGQRLAFKGASLFRLRDGKITSIVDQS